MTPKMFINSDADGINPSSHLTEVQSTWNGAHPPPLPKRGHFAYKFPYIPFMLGVHGGGDGGGEEGWSFRTLDSFISQQ